MIIYIFRHAQKAMDFSGDPDLTDVGHGQALLLLKKVLNVELPTPTQLWTSPKARAQSTFRPLAHHLKIPLQLQDSLLEQTSDEDMSAFRERVRRVLEQTATLKNEVIFVCSHYDWVVEAMAVIPTDKDTSEADFSHWTPAQHVGFKLNDDGIFEYIELKRISL
ncbi:Histidine phosphatase superfamily [compost metagenome]